MKAHPSNSLENARGKASSTDSATAQRAFRSGGPAKNVILPPEGYEKLRQDIEQPKNVLIVREARRTFFGQLSATDVLDRWEARLR